MSSLIKFPGSYGIIVGISLLGLAWLIAWLRIKGESFHFDIHGEKGSFAPLLSSYLDIAKFVLGLASGSIVLLAGSATLRTTSHVVSYFASPLFLLALSILYGVFFMATMIVNYEGYRHSTQPYTRLKYVTNLALGFSCLLCFSVGYLWLVLNVIRQA